MPDPTLALAYISRIRNADKREYARQWLSYCQGESTPPDAGLTPRLERREVRRRLAEYGFLMPEFDAMSLLVDYADGTV